MKRHGSVWLLVVLFLGSGCMVPGQKGTSVAGSDPALAAASPQEQSEADLKKKRAELDRLYKELEKIDQGGPPPSEVPLPARPAQPSTTKPPEAAPPVAAPGVPGPAASSEVQKVLEQMSKEEKLKRQVADDLVRRGDQKRRSGDFQAASELYRRALDAYPKHLEAQEKLDQTLFLLGQRRASARRLAETLQEEERVAMQERLSRVDRLIQQAVSAMAELRLEEAQSQLLVAQAQLALIPQSAEVVQRRKRIEARLTDVKNLLAKQRRQTREEQQREIQKIIEKDRALRQRLQQAEIEALLGRAREAYRIQDFAQCAQICTSILEIDSTNLQALGLLRKTQKEESAVARRKLREEDRYNRTLTFDDLDEATIPPEAPFEFPQEAYWNEIVKGRAKEVIIGQVEDTPEVKEIKRKLATVKVHNWDFDNKPLSDVVDFIKQVVAINIKIDRDVDPEETKVSLRLPEAVLKDALELIMENTGLAYTFRNNVLVITVPEKARGQAVFKIYNVTDILSRVRNFPGPTLDIRTPDEERMEAAGAGGAGGPGGGAFTFGEEEEETQISPDDLVMLVKDSTGGEEVWQEPMSIEVHQNQLLVEATPELHAKVSRVLQELRRDSDIFVVVRARFVDISDDFLEDIGIDYRNLGQRQTPWRRTYSARIPDSRTGGQDPGFTEGVESGTDVGQIANRIQALSPDWVGRMQHILDGFSSLIRGDRVFGGPGGLGGLSLQYMAVDPFQINAILRAVQEHNDVRSVVAPEVVAHNGQRVYVSVITQRSYIADYELVSGGTTWTLTEVADPIVRVNEEGVVLDVRPTVSADRKYITIDVQPTLATLIGGVISTILINLGTVMAAAMQVPIGLPRMSIQRTWTSVTVPNGGTVLLGGFRSLNEAKYISTVPILGEIPILNLLLRRRAELKEKRSLIILVSAQMIDLRREEAEKFGL